MADDPVAKVESPAAATPAPAAVTSPASDAGALKTTVKVADRAPTTPDRSAFERRVFEQLDEGHPPAEARKRASEAEPAEQPESTSQGGVDAERGTTHRTGAADRGLGREEERPTTDRGAATGGGKTPAAAEPKYDGLDAKSRQALSQTHLLPDPAVWEAMDLGQRTNMLAASKELLRSRSREFQAGKTNGNGKHRDESGRFAPTDTTDDGAGLEPGDEVQTDDAGGQARQPAQKPTPTGQRRPGTPPPEPTGDVRTQSPPGARPGTAQLPPEEVAALTEAYGEEGAKPIIASLQRQQQQFNDQMAQLNQANLSTQQHAAAAIRTQLKAEERTARTSLAAELPKLATDETAWGKVAQNAKMLAQAAYSNGQEWNWQECLTTAARALFKTDIHQEAQRSLATNRKQSLRTTPERGNEQSRPANAISKDEWDQVALEALDTGKTADEVLQSKRAGALA